MSSPASIIERTMPRVRLKIYSDARSDDTGGPRLPNSWPVDSCSCPFGPHADQRLHRASAPTFWSMDLSLWMIHITLHHFVRYFPTNRAGASNPGDGSISYGTGILRLRPGKLRHLTIYCRRAKRLLGEDAVPCGLASATTQRSSSCAAACLPAPRLNSGGLVSP